MAERRCHKTFHCTGFSSLSRFLVTNKTHFQLGETEKREVTAVSASVSGFPSIWPGDPSDRPIYRHRPMHHFAAPLCCKNLRVDVSEQSDFRRNYARMLVMATWSRSLRDAFKVSRSHGVPTGHFGGGFHGVYIHVQVYVFHMAASAGASHCLAPRVRLYVRAAVRWAAHSSAVSLAH